ncbi:MAG: heparinase II/III family protein, partial [Alphaproteobacteria bacterium]
MTRMQKFWRWLVTVVQVPPMQLVARIWARLKGLYHRTPLYPMLLEREEFPLKPALTIPLTRTGNAARGKALAEKGDFTFVGRTIRMPYDMGQRVNWQPVEAERLWVFNLHYWDWLADLHAADARDTALKLVEDWLLECDAYQNTIWHPYPTSLRLVNALQYAPWVLKEASPALIDAYWSSLHRQASFLEDNVEWDVRGNHLIKNIKALMFTGLGLPNRQSLFLNGQKLLQQELAHQIPADGAHFERSPMYHVQVLEDVLDIQALYRKAQLKVPPYLTAAIERMASALAFYMYPDGKLPLMNDSHEGDVEHLAALARKVGVPDALPVELSEAGFVRLQKGDMMVMLDAGKIPAQQPGHAHAEALAIELCMGEERVVVNCGTFAYQHPLRQPLRGTMAHSTVCVDEEDSAAVWAQHRVG